MRYSALLAPLLVVLPFPARGAETGASYFNDRYGYEIAVPAGFVGGGEPDAHDGQVFRSSDGNSVLTVFGGYLAEGSFDDQVAERLTDFRKAGWNVTYQAQAPSWASYSGTKGRRVSYDREIAGCDGSQFAAFELQYPSAQIRAMDKVVSRLVASLKQVTCSP
jgi:hypothetical protein